MVTRRGTRHSRPTPPPTCLHCGAQGHIATVCPRTTYLPDIPALKCTHCIRTIRSGTSSEPVSTQIVVIIDPCIAHSSPVVRPAPPSSTTSSAPTARSAARPPPPPRPIVPGLPGPVVPGLAPAADPAPNPAAPAPQLQTISKFHEKVAEAGNLVHLPYAAPCRR